MLTAPFDLSEVSPNEFWATAEPFRGNDLSFHIEPPQELRLFREFVTRCRAGEYPDSIPALPSIVDPRIAGLLQEAWDLANVVLQELREQFGSYQQVDAPWQADDERLSFGLSKRALRYTEHDHWLPTFVSSVLVKLTDWESHDWTAIGDQLDHALEKVRNRDVHRRTPRERLEELLLMATPTPS